MQKVVIYDADNMALLGFLYLEDACKIHRIDFDTANNAIQSTGLYSGEKVTFAREAI